MQVQVTAHCASALRKPRGLRALLRDRQGLAAIEFAYVLPLLLLVILYGIELANYAITREKLSELAMQISDNSSRMGAQVAMTSIPITEAMINDVFIGADLQSGDKDFRKKARIILSSLETNAKNGQWIHWQRCWGDKFHPSSYGKEGDGEDSTEFPGMGPSKARIKAPPGLGVMFVEMSVDYTPIISTQWAPSTQITEIATFNVRDDRDLSAVYNPEGVDVSLCTAS